MWNNINLVYQQFILPVFRNSWAIMIAGGIPSFVLVAILVRRILRSFNLIS